MIPAVALDQVPRSVTQKEVVFNGNIEALSKAALFGVKSRTHLQITFYGGNLPAADGSIVQIPIQTKTLTASQTNYVSVSPGGVISIVTVAPTGWPGPLAGAERALYSFVVGANDITSGISYLMGPAVPGVKGATGPQGPAGVELYLTRKRFLGEGQFGSSSLPPNVADFGGFEITIAGSPSTPTLVNYSSDSSTFIGGIARLRVTDGGTTNCSGQLLSQAFCLRGNAAGMGGFEVDMRFGIGTVSSNTTLRSFFGLIIGSVGTVGNNDPSNLTDMIGIGADAGDANLSIFCNDASGTATKTTLGANFPASSANKVYELHLECEPSASSIDYSVTEVEGGNVASGSLSSNIPTDTAFLAWIMLTGKGSATGVSFFDFMQVTGYTRY